MICTQPQGMLGPAVDATRPETLSATHSSWPGGGQISGKLDGQKAQLPLANPEAPFPPPLHSVPQNIQVKVIS